MKGILKSTFFNRLTAIRYMHCLFSARNFKLFGPIVFLILAAHSVPAAEITFPYSENFDGTTVGDPGTLPPFWINVSGENAGDTCHDPVMNCYDWIPYTGATPSTLNGPSADHTTGSGSYIYVEADSNANTLILLRSPLIDLTLSTAPQLTFWVHRNYGVSPQYDIRKLHIDLTDDSGNTQEEDILVVDYEDTSDVWKEQIIDLTPYKGHGEIRVQFRWSSRRTNSSRPDVAIDDFILEDLDPTIDAYDFGDANGYGAASHSLQPIDLYLGAIPGDQDSASQDNSTADGDDTDGNDDEDGVTISSPNGGSHAVIRADVQVVNDSGGDASVCAWLDRWDSSGAGTGSFDSGDIATTPAQACQTVADNNGTATTVTFIWDSSEEVPGHTYARFRVCTAQSECEIPTGNASNGEVEDYRIDFDFAPTLAVIDNFRVELVTVRELLANTSGSSGADSAKNEDKSDTDTTISALSEALQNYSLEDEVAVIRWDTLQEHGTVGFYVEQKPKDHKHWQRLNSESMLPGLINAPLGGEYLLLDLNVSRGETHSYRLIEKEIWGTKQTYGPWQVTLGGATSPTIQMPGYSTNQTNVKSSHTSQHSTNKHWSKWRLLEQGYAGRARQATPPLIETRSYKQSSATKKRSRVDRIRLYTKKEEMYQVSLTDLAAVTGIKAKRIARKLRHGRWSFSTGDGSAAYYYDTKQQIFIFAADTYLTTETMDNVYRLGKFSRKQGWNMAVVNGFGPEAGRPDQFRDTINFAEENMLLSWVHHDENEDYGYWDYIYAPYKGTADLSINLPDPAATSQEPGSLKILLRGTSSQVEGNDHLARVYLNGELLTGEIEWDGTNQAILEVPFEQALLMGTEAGETVTATVTIEGEALNGAPYSMFFVEALALSYDRKMYAHDNAIRLHDTTAGVVTVDGFDSADIMVMEAPNTQQATWREDITIDQTADGFQVSFESSGGDYQLSSAPLTPQLEADQPSRLLSRRNNAEYLIIAPRTLQQSAKALSEYRSARFNTRIIWLQDVYDIFSSGRVHSAAIEDFLKSVHSNWQHVPEYIVLMGRGTLDHPDRKGYGESLIPLRIAATPWGLIGSDNRYADVDDDHVPEYSIGRIAVSTEADGLAYVDKLKGYEAQPPAAWNNNAVVVADNPDPGAGNFHFNSDETADTLQGYGISVDKLYHPDTPVRNTLLVDWAAGKYAFVNYDGHGGRPRMGTASENFLSTDDVASLKNGVQLPIFAALTCGVGDSSYPGILSLGDSLSLQADGGSIVSFVPTGLSLDGPAHQLNISFIEAIMGQEASVGNAFRHALQQVKNDHVAPFMLDVYSISGDPAVLFKKGL